MNTSNNRTLIESVGFGDEKMYIELSTNRVLAVPYSYTKRLESARKEDLVDYRLIANGVGIHFEKIDEDISVEGIIRDFGSETKRINISVTTDFLDIADNYAKKHQLDWVEDESNTDESFDRNFIRHQVMPLLAQRWPSVLSTFARSAQHCQSGQELLDELAEQDLQQCYTSLFTGEQGLETAYLQSLSIARFNNLVRFFLAQAKGLMPSVEQLAQLHQQLFAQADKTPMVKVGQYWLRRFQSVWYLTDDFANISAWQIALDLDELKTKRVRVNLPDNLASLSFSLQDVTPECLTRQSTRQLIKAPQLTDKITIRFNHSNPRCLPDFRQNSRPLKKVLQELEIPPWQRKRIAFLYYNEELVAALGYFVCKTFLPKNDEKYLIISSSNDTN